MNEPGTPIEAIEQIAQESTTETISSNQSLAPDQTPKYSSIGLRDFITKAKEIRDQRKRGTHDAVLRTQIDRQDTQLKESKLKQEQTEIEKAEAEKLARVDPLTGLPNRRWFDEEAERKIAEARRSGEGFWYLHMDVDKFKILNDQFAHAGGDEILKLFGVIDLRKGDQLARIGGDEFALFLKGDMPPESIAILVERIQTQLSALSKSVLSHLEINPNRELLDEPIKRESSFSFGATKFNPNEFDTEMTSQDITNALKDRADRGTSFSKKEGRDMGTITEVINGEEKYIPMIAPQKVAIPA